MTPADKWAIAAALDAGLPDEWTAYVEPWGVKVWRHEVDGVSEHITVDNDRRWQSTSSPNWRGPRRGRGWRKRLVAQILAVHVTP